MRDILLAIALIWCLWNTYNQFHNFNVDKIVDELEPQDLAPIIHAKWKRDLIRNNKGGCIYAKMICSNCRNDNLHDEYMPFCPNCGAKMDIIEE